MSTQHGIEWHAILDLYAEGHALGDIAVKLGLDYSAEEGGRIYLSGYVADDGNCEVGYPDAESGREAARLYVEEGEWGDEYRTRTLAHTVSAGRRYVYRNDDDELDDTIDDDTWDSHLVTIEPDAPECPAATDGEHRWSDDYELVGGCRQSPGVWAGGGCSIITTYVCVLCGLGKRHITNSQGYETEYDYDRTCYGDEADNVTIDDLVRYHGDSVPDGLDPDSALAAALAPEDEPENDGEGSES